MQPRCASVKLGKDTPLLDRRALLFYAKSTPTEERMDRGTQKGGKYNVQTKACHNYKHIKMVTLSLRALRS